VSISLHCHLFSPHALLIRITHKISLQLVLQLSSLRTFSLFKLLSLVLQPTKRIFLFHQNKRYTFLIMRASTASIILAICAMLAVQAAPACVDSNSNLAVRELGLENALVRGVEVGEP